MAILKINGEEKHIIDECYPLVKFFNEIGLETICSWKMNGRIGIIFAKTVTDTELIKLSRDCRRYYGDKVLAGKFIFRTIDNKSNRLWTYKAKIVDAEHDYNKLTKRGVITSF